MRQTVIEPTLVVRDPDIVNLIGCTVIQRDITDNKQFISYIHRSQDYGKKRNLEKFKSLYSVSLLCWSSPRSIKYFPWAVWQRCFKAQHSVGHCGHHHKSSVKRNKDLLWSAVNVSAQYQREQCAITTVDVFELDCDWQRQSNYPNTQVTIPNEEKSGKPQSLTWYEHLKTFVIR